MILSLAHLDDDDRVLVLGLPTKAPLVALMKQARAYGVGMVLATQNPMDLDYRALSNAGMWFVGRLQTDADRERVVDGMADAGVSGTRARRCRARSRSWRSGGLCCAMCTRTARCWCSPGGR